MIDKRRIELGRRTLSVEALEDRTLPSGVVSAALEQTTGLLQIQGDTGNNALTLTPSPIPGDIRVAGVTGTFTSVNGVSFTDFPLYAITGITITLGNGTQNLTVAGFNIPGNFLLSAGDNQDPFSLQGKETFALVNFNANLIGITTGTGNNTVNLASVKTGAVTVSTSTGSDSVSLIGDTIGLALIDTGGLPLIDTGTGTVADSITVSGSTVGTLTTTSGDGNNTLSVTNNQIARAILTTGTGANTVDVSNDTFTSNTADTALSVTVDAVGNPNNVQTVTLSNLVFNTNSPNVLNNGSLAVTVGDALPADPNANLSASPSTLTVSQIAGVDDVSVSVGANFDTVALDTVNARSLTASVGDNTTNFALNGLTVAGPLDVTVGANAQNVRLAGIVTAITSPLDLALGRLADVNVTIGDGAQSVTLNRIQVGRNLTITAGTGDTTFSIAQATIGQDLNFTTGFGNNTILMDTVRVLNQLTIQTSGKGINNFAARNVTCAFGTVDGGSGPSNVYWDQGGNVGFAVLNFSGYLVGPNPPTLDDSDLSLSATTIPEGQSVTLNGSFVHAGNTAGHTVTITWGDGSADTQLDLAPNVFSFSAPHQYQSASADGTAGGADTITVAVTDSDNNRASASTSITVTNVPPANLQLTLPSATVNAGDPATLTGSFTDPGTLDTHTVVIDWGDGSTATTLNLDAGVLTFGPISHVYLETNASGPTPTTNTVHVTVTDEANASTSASTPVMVRSVPPADLHLDLDRATINEGDTATLTGSFADPGIRYPHAATINWNHTVVINWGDGSDNTVLGLDDGVLQFSASHPYLKNLPGNAPYTIGVTVSDPANESTSASTLLTVNNVAPTAQAGPDQTVPEETPVTLNGTFTDPGTAGGDGHTFNWTVTSSNGQVIPAGSGPSFTFTPNDDGQYTVSLTVTDSDGGVGTSTATVTATRVPPALSLSGAATVDADSPYTLNLSGQEAGADTITSWTITWGDGAVQTVTGNPGAVTHVYAQGPASYTITAQASDEDGTSSAANTLTVQVTPVTDGAATLTLSGPASGSPLSPYTLTLSAASGTGNITSWTINWGDGTAQTVDGNPGAVTHTYVLVPRSYTISAVATVAGRSVQAGNTLTVNLQFASDAENFVAQVYQDVLGRPADAVGLRDWTSALAAGSSRYQVVLWITTSTEYRTRVVEQLYAKYLGRAADPVGLGNDLLALAGGATTDQIKASILGSDEYFQRRGGASLDGFIAALYQDVLGRAATPGESQAWVQAVLFSSRPDTPGVNLIYTSPVLSSILRTGLASVFLGSVEGNQVLVQSDFQQYLHRPADADGLNSLVQARLRGATPEVLLADIVASDEYFANLHRSQGS